MGRLVWINCFKCAPPSRNGSCGFWEPGRHAALTCQQPATSFGSSSSGSIAGKKIKIFSFTTIANRQVRDRIQAYFESKGAPPPFDPKEYPFFFEQAFGVDTAAQQQFLSGELNTAKISLNIGHRALAAMMIMGAEDRLAARAAEFFG